jgi:hypothetical protein
MMRPGYIQTFGEEMEIREVRSAEPLLIYVDPVRGGSAEEYKARVRRVWASSSSPEKRLADKYRRSPYLKKPF